MEKFTRPKVSLLLDSKTGEVVALKKIKLESVEEGMPSTVIREIALLKDLQHPHILRLYDVKHSDENLTLVLEYVDSDLKKILDSTGPEGLTLATIKSYLYQLTRGVLHVHQHKFLHRDLKPQNVLVNKDGILKLADFGLARAFGIPVKNYSSEVVTLWYRAPDILMGSTTYNTSVDLWSIGCIMAELYTKKALFMGSSDEDQILKIFNIRGTPSLEEWPEMKTLSLYKSTITKYPGQSLSKVVPRLEKDKDAIDLIDKLLQCNPAKRINAKDALAHPYFKDVPMEIKNLK